MAIHLRLRDLRMARGLTQVQLAEKCGMPQSTISRIESGSTTGVDFQTLDKLADALGVHPSELIGFDRVTFDHDGRSFIVEDVTREVANIPRGASAVWRIKGTPITFGTPAGATPGSIIKTARTQLTGVEEVMRETL